MSEYVHGRRLPEAVEVILESGLRQRDSGHDIQHHHEVSEIFVVDYGLDEHGQDT